MTHVYPTHHKNHQISIRPVSVADCVCCMAGDANYSHFPGLDEGWHEAGF